MTCWICSILLLGHAGNAQRVTMRAERVPLKKVLDMIETQSGFHFIYTTEQLQHALPVTVNLVNGGLRLALDECFREQPLAYAIVDSMIIISYRPSKLPLLAVQGIVRDEQHEPLAGVSVRIKGSEHATVTDAAGKFSLLDVTRGSTLIISGAEHETKEIIVNGQDLSSIELQNSPRELDQLLVIAYGKTTRRNNTGHISTIKADALTLQTQTNPFLGLLGQAPGLLINPSSGLNGSAVQISIRGRNSAAQGSAPLFLIDGIPFAGANERLNRLDNATGEAGLTPMVMIDAANIQTVSILKDAEATAIYGSRGANGVVLINLLKPSGTKPSFSISSMAGIGWVKRPAMLTTDQYRAMRREAFANDGLSPSSDPFSSNYAPDLFWDSTRNTDLGALLIGHRSATSNIQLNYTGNAKAMSFRVSAGLFRSTSVLASRDIFMKPTASLRLLHRSTDGRMELDIHSTYTFTRNRMPLRDLTNYIDIPPHIQLYDGDGSPSWETDGIPLRSTLFRPNPLAVATTIYRGDFSYLFENLQWRYRFRTDFQVVLQAGFNGLSGDEYSAHPTTSLDPYSGDLPDAAFSKSSGRNWIVEPRIEFDRHRQKHRWKVLVGSSWQDSHHDGSIMQGFHYPNDLQLGSINGAPVRLVNTTFSQYRYVALFSRLGYELDRKIFLSLSARRDGSSRFGPARRFSNFAALGAAWHFVNSAEAQKRGSLLGFGKLRLSYGITGNDQIGDYRYLDTWTMRQDNYNSALVMQPNALFNPDYTWERTSKLEAALETAWLDDRLFFSVSGYRHCSSNLLMDVALPVQTGFNSILKNVDGLVENKGVELEVGYRSNASGNVRVHVSINLSRNENRLKRLPGAAVSDYSQRLYLGASLNALPLYELTGVDPSTGLYRFADRDGNGIINKVDRTKLADADANWNGGMQGEIMLSRFTVSFNFSFRQQSIYNAMSDQARALAPGLLALNQPRAVLRRWVNPGDEASIQRFTAVTGSAAHLNTFLLAASDGAFVPSSTLRLESVGWSYTFPERWSRKWKVARAVAFISGQNLMTICNVRSVDPLVPGIYTLPLLRMISGGFQLTF